MSVVILKFGGASVASPDHFKRIGELVVEAKQRHRDVVAVVSAMADTTDQLIALAHEVNPKPPRRELDMLVTVGERISISLLAMTLSAMGVEAMSFTGSQSGIITSSDHTDAKIVDMRPRRIQECLDQGKVAIVAGFQGVSRESEITTLGRGGSDTSAVALGVALEAEEVWFYKDVNGVYDRDPKRNKGARHLGDLSFEEAIAVAGVLHERSIRLAQKNGLSLVVTSFLGRGERKSFIRGGGARGQAVYEEVDLSIVCN